MRTRWILTALLLALLLVTGAGCASSQAAVATPTRMKTPRPTFTNIPKPTSVPTITSTPTVAPTLPPTATPVPPTATATATPRPTNTPLPVTPKPAPPTATPEPQVGKHGVIGRLRTREARSDYAVNERVYFVLEVENTLDGIVHYGILGLKPDQGMPFRSTWTAEYEDRFFPARETFAKEDELVFTAPGTYTVKIAICFSPFKDCREASAEWEEFGYAVVNIR